MAVLRYWAGARAAAGVEQERVEAATLREALDAARAGRDERFARVIAVCSFVVDEQPVGRTPAGDVQLASDAVVEVLPPFAGGSEPPVGSEVVRSEAGHLSLHLPDWRAPVLGAVLAGVVVAGALAGEAWLWVAVGALQLALVLTWHRSLDAPSAASGAVVGAGLAAIVDVIVATTEGDPGLGPIAVVLGAGYLIAVVQQLVRRDGREHLVDGLAATVSLATIAAFGAAWVVVWQLPGGDDNVVVLAGAACAAAVGRLAPGLNGAAIGPLAAGVVAGALLGASVDDVGLGAALGLAAALPAGIAAVMQAQVRGAGIGWFTGAVWPVLVAAPLGYIAVRVVS